MALAWDLETHLVVLTAAATDMFPYSSMIFVPATTCDACDDDPATTGRQRPNCSDMRIHSQMLGPLFSTADVPYTRVPRDGLWHFDRGCIAFVVSVVTLVAIGLLAVGDDERVTLMETH
jgi:hypothetical protein